MGIINPGKMRALITEVGGQLQITIPTKKNLFLILFSAAWLVGWAVGEFTVPTTFFHKGKDAAPLLFTTAWLAAWTVGGVFAIYTWFWQAFGKEIITVDGSYISTKKDIFELGKLNQYQTSHVKNLRTAPMVYDPSDVQSDLQFWGLGGGNLAFDYGARTYRLAIGVDEAKAILDRILTRSPNLASKD